MATKNRLIDTNEAEEALVSVKEWFTGDQCTKHDKLAQAVVKMCIEEIKKIKPVEAVEVVRCKDCKCWGGVVYGGRCKYWSAPLSGTTHFTSADDFCSYGERRKTDG